jgi:hypothetical protein
MKSFSVSYLLLLLVSDIRADENAVNTHEKIKNYVRLDPPCPDQMYWKYNGRTAFSGTCEFCPPGTIWKMSNKKRGMCEDIPKNGYGLGPVPLPNPELFPNPYPITGPSYCGQGEIYLPFFKACGPCPPGTVYRNLANGQETCAEL